MKADALGWVEAGRGLVGDDELWIAKQSLRNAETPAHAAGEARHGPVADFVEIGSLQQRLNLLTSELRGADPLQDGQVIQKCLRRNSWIDAEFLRQVAQPAPHMLRLFQNVNAIEMYRSARRHLQRGQNTH